MLASVCTARRGDRKSTAQLPEPRRCALSALAERLEGSRGYSVPSIWLDSTVSLRA